MEPAKAQEQNIRDGCDNLHLGDMKICLRIKGRESHTWLLLRPKYFCDIGRATSTRWQHTQSHRAAKRK